MLLKVEEVEKRFVAGGHVTPVLQGVSFDLDVGGTLALTGESGSGKSTLLHLIAGLDSIDAGAIYIEGADLGALADKGRAALRRGTVGLVFQQFNLIPSLTVRDNITFHARLSGREDRQWSAALAERIGLADQLDKYPEALSGGQQQRAAIARTLAARPRLVLADEPTGNLDEDTAETVLSLLLDTAREAQAALLMVTHSSHHASRMDRQLRLSHGRLAA
ncbi:ABC transporter ATP-binding protein [Thalassococcus sp. S3]|uniref:ABC transporter ATP-binding protein n=1 Tax=Thalassococcus sp. S3 TaxID=2017482 RepID=UPI0010241825|nr:ABC transporter ATP-binding protein [Thalassococcus sp. S3]QBF31174.1 ABC transporter ATP-binding protein [Thalassococcus sp. S3]